jgi:hypothetical protein
MDAIAAAKLLNALEGAVVAETGHCCSRMLIEKYVVGCNRTGGTGNVRYCFTMTCGSIAQSLRDVSATRPCRMGKKELIHPLISSHSFTGRQVHSGKGKGCWESERKETKKGRRRRSSL